MGEQINANQPQVWGKDGNEDHELPMDVLQEISYCLDKLRGLSGCMHEDTHEYITRPLEKLLELNGVNTDDEINF